MSIEQSDVERVMETNGFERTHATKKVVEYRSTRSGKFVYFRREIGLPGYVRIVVHPSENLTSLVAISGVELNVPKDLQHGTNMTQFPKRKNNGVDEIHYGKAMNISTIGALGSFAMAFHSL